LLVLALILTLTGSTGADEPAVPSHGTICLAPVKDDGDPRGYYSEHFSVRVDDGDWFDVPSDKPFSIGELATQEKHLVSVRDGDITIESFWFRFEQYESPDLCLWYKPWYRTWSLWPASNAGKRCRCDVGQRRRTG